MAERKHAIIKSAQLAIIRHYAKQAGLDPETQARGCFGIELGQLNRNQRREMINMLAEQAARATAPA